MSIFIATLMGILGVVYIIYSGIIIGGYTAGIRYFIHEIHEQRYRPINSIALSVSIALLFSGLMMVASDFYLGKAYPLITNFLSDTSLAIFTITVMNVLVTLFNPKTTKSLIFDEVGWYVSRLCFILLPYPLMFLSVYHYYMS